MSWHPSDVYSEQRREEIEELAARVLRDLSEIMMYRLKEQQHHWWQQQNDDEEWIDAS